MFIPEIPLIDLRYRAECPVCRETMGGHLVRDAFSCPFCRTRLVSNRTRAGKQALLLAIVLYLVSLALYNLVDMHEVGWLILAIVANIGAVVFSYLLFKLRLKIEVAGNP